ncbi:class I SAM-dependent methyltransferase [Methylomicrobium lacus]|uniref:class I SAM-dependent methyltransferase n=1 Tax=Methylomicrobium lacus TaxID=136992 RepID=UPI0035A93A96
MKILVTIANYGMKNIEYAKQLIKEYRSMRFDVDIFVLSEAPKNYGADVTVLVGLPSKDPWSLPFAHKQLFAENVEKYDLFIHTEDDTLIRQENIIAFLKATEAIDDEFIPGFVRYELYPNGKKNYPDVFGSYHWVPGSVRKSGEYVFAKFSNDHSACFILTQEHLRRALASGGFLVPPHSGRYDLICSAGTDPYTQCGLTRVICFSHMRDFEIHHLSNAYLNRVGLDEERYNLQLEALREILEHNRSSEELFVTEKPLHTPVWDKSYYEPCRYDILRLIPAAAKEILSVGCGWGTTETHLIEEGKRVVVIPIDSVIGKLGEKKDIQVLSPDFKQSFEMLAGRKFDAIVLSEVLQHLPNPVEILTELGSFLNDQGVIVGSVPNLSLTRRLSGRLFGRSKKRAQIYGPFDKTMLNLTNTSLLKSWLMASSLRPLAIRYEDYETVGPLSVLAAHLPGLVAASNIIFAVELMTA